MKTSIAARRRALHAFTLIELLVVIIILAILAAVVLPRVIGKTDDARQGAVRASISNFDQALEMYKADVGTFPSNEEGLQALLTNTSNNPKWNGPYLKGTSTLSPDPWGQPFQYRYPSEHGQADFDVYSNGPPEKPEPIGNFNLQGR